MCPSIIRQGPNLDKSKLELEKAIQTLGELRVGSC